MAMEDGRAIDHSHQPLAISHDVSQVFIHQVKEMSRRFRRFAPALVAVAVAFAWLTAQPSGRSAGPPSTKKGDWTHYTADMHGTKYSPLDQINATNFNK